MLLLEITNPHRPAVRKSEIEPNPRSFIPQHDIQKTYIFNPDKMPTRFKRIGGGYGGGYGSSIYLDLKHPNRVLKSVVVDSLNDPYVRFIKTADKFQDNPFFPRIYGYKIIENQFPGNVDAYQIFVFMERLVPIHKLNNRVARYLLKRVGINFDANWNLEDDDSELAVLTSDPNERKRIRSTTDYPKFKQALRVLEPLFRAYGSDMKIDNIMVRQTKTEMPQIVLVDPIYPDLSNK
jgi:hypothetical protein